MKLLMTKIALLTACLTMSACVFSDSPGKPGVLTKEAAAKISNPGEDLCDVYNWYGDGECDTFCENADPDCETQCDEVPVCTRGYETIACQPGIECYEVSLCGTTIYCQPDVDCLSLLSQPYPECPEGYDIVDECVPDGGDCLTSGGFCGLPETICQASRCEDAAPVCPEGTHPAQEWAGCGEPNPCIPDIDCNGYPTCADGMVEVESCDDAQDVYCVEETLCGTTISCAELHICDLGIGCPANYIEVESCPADTNCYEETSCGGTVMCMEVTEDCLAYPICLPGTKEVPACEPNATCTSATMCGVTIICQGGI